MSLCVCVCVCVSVCVVVGCVGLCVYFFIVFIGLFFRLHVELDWEDKSDEQKLQITNIKILLCGPLTCGMRDRECRSET